MVASIYAAEVSPPEMRGAVLGSLNFAIVAGINTSFWTAYGCRHITSALSWRVPFLVPIFPGTIVAIAAFLIPFTPRWLAMVGRDAECLDTIAKLRQLPSTDQRVQREWMEVLAEVAFEERVAAERYPTLVGNKTFTSSIKLELAAWRELFRPGCLRRTHVGAVIAFFQQWVGISSVLYYTPTLLEYVESCLNVF